MSSFEIRFLKRAEKDLRKISSQSIKRIVSKIDALSKEPRSAQAKKLVGGHNEYRLRVGDYRVLYTIDEKQKRVTIYRIAHRKSVYEYEGIALRTLVT